MHPSVNDRLSGEFGIVPVFRHHQVSLGEQFSGYADGRSLSLGINNLHLAVRLNAPHRPDPEIDRVIDGGLKRHGTCFGHAVGDRDFLAAHITHNPPHQRFRAR